MNQAKFGLIFDPSNSFDIVLHELGHTLGLEDIDFGADIPSDKIALMRSDGNLKRAGELFPDDLLGVHYAYCRLYLKTDFNRCRWLDPKEIEGSYPNFNATMQPLYSLGQVKLENRKVDAPGWAEYCAEVQGLNEGSSLAKAGIKNGDCLYLNLRASVGNVAENINDQILFSKGPSTTLSFLRREGSEKWKGGLPKVQVELSVTGIPLYARDNKSGAKTSDLHYSFPIVQTIDDVRIQGDKAQEEIIPKGTYLTALKEDSARVFTKYFRVFGWIDRKSVKAAP